MKEKYLFGWEKDGNIKGRKIEEFEEYEKIELMK